MSGRAASRAVALRGPLKKRPPQGDGDRATLAVPARRCERNETTQSHSAEAVWIASAFAKASADKSLRSQ